MACGHAVRLAETDGVLTGDDLPDEAERILELLAAFGVVPEPFEPDSASPRRAPSCASAPPIVSGIPPLAVGG